MGRRPPSPARRHLRQEANFGCVVCGTPIIQYHHIVPFSEQPRHELDDMVALCPNHHAHADRGAISKSKLRRLKKEPYIDDIVEHSFYFESEMSMIEFAGNYFALRDADEMDIIEIEGQSIITIHFDNDILEFSLQLFNEDEELVAEIDRNEWLTYVEEAWDMEYRPTNFKIWHDRRDIGLEVEYNSEEDRIFMRGNFYYGDILVRATPSKIVFPGRGVLRGETIVDGSTAISID